MNTIKPIVEPSKTQLSDGREAELFIADMNNVKKQELCVIPKRVLGYLTNLLPKASLADIIENFSLKAGECKTITDWTELLAEELEFTASVNMLQQYFAQLAESENVEQLVAR